MFGERRGTDGGHKEGIKGAGLAQSSHTCRSTFSVPVPTRLGEEEGSRLAMLLQLQVERKALDVGFGEADRRLSHAGQVRR